MLMVIGGVFMLSISLTLLVSTLVTTTTDSSTTLI